MPQNYMLMAQQGSDQDDEWVRLGIEAHVGNRLGEAQQKYQQALRLNPRNAVATQNLALVFAQNPGSLNEGLLTIERAALFDGQMPIIHANRALMCLDAERIDEALESARYAVSISKSADEVRNLPNNHLDWIGRQFSRLALALILPAAGLPKESIPVYNEILELEPNNPQAGLNACFSQTLTFSTPAELAEQRRKWWEANRWRGEKKPYQNDKNPDRPIRVGYVGGDFKQHSASMIFANVLYNHTDAVEVYCYSNLPVDPCVDGMTGKYQAKCGAVTEVTRNPDGTNKVVTTGGRWRDVSAKNDDELEALIRQDKIDILVDLAAHTAGGRLSIFTRKPAPIQVTAWGFAHGTGCPEIDYFFADPVAVPQEERQHYVEKIWDLPCIVTYWPEVAGQLKGTSRLPYFENDFITFGAYARYEKFTDECLDTFAEIMRRVPDAKIEFKDHGFRRPYSCQRVLDHFKDIAKERVLFSISTSHPDHMLSYHQADLILNPFPHSGGLVSMETLWMGVPFVTLNSSQASGRSGASILTLLGRTDWIAKTPLEYVEKAVALAGDIPTLKNARKTLRDELAASPAIKDYHLAVEKAYREMWKEWCSK